MTDIARRDQTPADIARLLGMNPSDPKTQAMVAVCARYELDPLLKHVVVIPGAGPYITRDGLLHVALKREVPEALKPRTIPVNGVEAPKVIEARKAA